MVMAWSDGDAALRQAGAQLGEIHRPVVLADRLDHLDRDDAVEVAVEIAIVLQAQIGAAAFDLGGETRSRAKASCSVDSVTPVTSRRGGGSAVRPARPSRSRSRGRVRRL